MSGALPPPVRAVSDELPARIGAYPIQAVIGTGSMGVVYLGHDPVIDRAVAVKTIQRHLIDANSTQDNVAQRFRVEARAAGRLNHRGIVAVHQFGEDENCAYIVMEYVRGHSLADYLRPPEKLAKGEVLCLMVQLLEALHYAHESGVIHRDIKPANLMVDRHGRLKITDFGIARTDAAQVTRVNTLVGSPGYMAPEQYTGGNLDRRVDVFSAGVLLYQMLAGGKPFTGSDEGIMYQIVYGKHQPLATRTGDASLAIFDAVIDKALAKVPDERYASAQEFLDALKGVAGGTIADHLVHDRLLPFKAPDEAGAAVPAATPSRPAVLPPSSSVSRPASEPVPTGWDETELAGLERELTRLVGPVAKVLVRRAARGQEDITMVRQVVAASIVDPAIRERFIAGQAAAPSGSRPRTSRSGFADSALPPGSIPIGETRLAPAHVERAAEVLKQSLGPIAAVLVKRCADKAPTRERFVALLLEQLVDRVDAKSLEAQLWRSMG